MRNNFLRYLFVCSCVLRPKEFAFINCASIIISSLTLLKYLDTLYQILLHHFCETWLIMKDLWFVSLSTKLIKQHGSKIASNRTIRHYIFYAKTNVKLLQAILAEHFQGLVNVLTTLSKTLYFFLVFLNFLLKRKFII